MKVEIGDKVIPTILIGTVTKILPTEIVVEHLDSKGEIRKVFFTEEDAKKRNLSFDDYVDNSLWIVEGYVK